MLHIVCYVNICLVRVQHLSKRFLELVSTRIVREQSINSTYTVDNVLTLICMLLVHG